MIVGDGRTVEAQWVKTGDRKDNLKLDAFVVVPNHLHETALIDKP